MVLRKNDVNVIEKLLETKPSLIVLNNCFYDDNDPLWPMVLEIAKKYHIKLLVHTPSGDSNGVLHCSFGLHAFCAIKMTSSLCQ